MRRTKFAGVLATAGIAVGLVAAAMSQAEPIDPPGQLCEAFLAFNPQITAKNAQGQCASFVAQGGNLQEEFPPGLCNELTGCRPPPILQ